jgi:serine/threonine-protein kinase
MPAPSLLQRLKERKLVQWALAYLAGAFVVLQLLDALAEPLGLTPTIQRAVLAVVGVGFFITLVLAWYHGEKGRQRVSGAELLMVAALLVVAGVALTLLHPQEQGISPVALEGDNRPGIAVFPCENWSSDPADASFASGVHDEILLRLSRISGLRSIGRETMEWYDERSSPTWQVAQELAVGYLGECSVLKDAGRNQIRLTFQLIDGNSGTQLWAQNYTEDLTARSIFDIHTDLALRIARAIGAALTPEERARNEPEPTDNLDALEAYMLGRHHLNRRDDDREAFSEAVRYFEMAIREDPDLAVAHGALAEVHSQMAAWGFRDPREVWPEVERWARSALALDTTVASAHLMLAPAQWVRDWNWEEAERRHQRALSLSPGDPQVHRNYTEFLMGQGRIEEAQQQLRIASALDPLSSPTLQSQARLAFFSRNYEEADGLVDVLLSRDPENSSAALAMAFSFLFGGRPEQVERLFPWMAADSANLRPGQRATRAVFLSVLGESELARTEIREASAGWGDQYFEPRVLWRTYAALGDKDEAFFWMGRSIDVQTIHAAFLAVDPFADGLRDDPRYQSILDRIGLGHLKQRFDSLAAADPRRGR